MRHIKTMRQQQRETSNNAEDPNKNICALKVAQALGVDHTQRYFHTIEDVKRAAGRRFSVRSVKSYVKSNTAGGARKAMPSIGAVAFIVWVPGHVLLMSADGKTIVDTAPRKADRRKLLGVWGLYPKG